MAEAGEAPTFVGPLVDTTADDGTCVQLKCKVHGARPMKILWHKYDIHLTPSSMYHMSYNETTGECMLEIVIVGRNDEGEFLCRAENVFGRAETAAELIVEGNPSQLFRLQLLVLLKFISNINIKKKTWEGGEVSQW